MKWTIIGISIVVPVIIAIVLSVVLYRYHKSEQKKIIPKKNMSVFKLDLKTRRVLILNILKTNISPFQEFVAGQWDSVNLIVQRFDEKNQKAFMNAFDKLDKGSTFEKFEIQNESLVYKNHTTTYKVKFNKLDDETGYYMTMSWDAVPNKKQEEAFSANRIEKEDVAVDSSVWKGFVAFNINNGSEHYTDKLLELVSRMYKVREIDFFTSAGYLIFFFKAEKAKSVKKKVNKFIRLFTSNGYSKGGNQLFEGSAYVISANVHDLKKVYQVVQTLDYLISLSIERKVNFLTRSKDISANEFETFVEASKSFRQSVRLKDIVNNSMTIRNKKNDRKVIDYLYPKIEGINSKLLSRILRNKNHIDLLIDAHADANIIDKSLDKPALIDITPNWIIKNASKLTNKKLIYVLRANSHKETPGLQEVLLDLQQKGFVFAIKVYDYTEVVTSLIQNAKPQFLVISKSVWNAEGLLDSDMLFKLMTIRKLADQIKAKMIFQNPSKLVDVSTADKIGLQFYYEEGQ